MPVNHSSSIDKLLDYVPDLLDKASNMMNKCFNDKKEKTKEVLKQIRENEKDIKDKILNNEKDEKIRKITIDKNIKKPENSNLEFEIEYEDKKDENIENTNDYEDE